MTFRKPAAISAAAVAIGAASLTLTAGTALADPWPWPNPAGPGVPGPGVPGPGVLPPPGHIGQIIGVPPGQWDKGPVFIPFCNNLNPGCINHI